MRIRAKFTGSNAAGFINGKFYNLEVEGSCVYYAQERKWLPYRSIEEFIRDWKILSTEEQA